MLIREVGGYGTITFHLYCNVSCFAVKGTEVIVSLDLVGIVISHFLSYEE